VGIKFRNPGVNHSNNIGLATLRLLEMMRGSAQILPVFYHASSSDIASASPNNPAPRTNATPLIFPAKPLRLLGRQWPFATQMVRVYPRTASDSSWDANGIMYNHEIAAPGRNSSSRRKDLAMLLPAIKKTRGPQTESSLR
jgi:GDP-D-mannose dehydratase